MPRRYWEDHIGGTRRSVDYHPISVRLRLRVSPLQGLGKGSLNRGEMSSFEDIRSRILPLREWEDRPDHSLEPNP
jgi:hypothetical protein